MLREEAKNWLNKLYARADITDEYGDAEDVQPYEEAIDMAIKALEQEPILEKIRAEIIELRSRQNVGVLECLDILDKYKAEIKSSVYEDKAERKTHSLVFDNEHEYQKFKNVLDTGWEPNF